MTMDPQQQQNKHEHNYSNDNIKDENNSAITPTLVFTSDCSSSSSSGCSDSGCCADQEQSPNSDYQGLGSTDTEHIVAVDTTEKESMRTSLKKNKKPNRGGVRFAPTFDDEEHLNNSDSHIHIDESGGNHHSMWQTERAPALPPPQSNTSYPSSLSPTSPSFPSSLSSATSQSIMSPGSMSAPSTPSTPSFSITQAPAPHLHNNSSGRRRLSSTGPCSNSVPCRQSSLKWKQRNGSATFELKLSQGEFMRCGGARYDDVA